MFERIKAFFAVLEKGNELRNPAAWKNGQTAANSGIIAILMILRTLVPEDYQLDDDTLSNIGLIIGSIGSLFNIYLTVATTTKVGFKRKCKGD